LFINKQQEIWDYKNMFRFVWYWGSYIPPWRRIGGVEV